MSKRSIEEIQVILESKEFSRNSLEKELGNIDNLEEYFGLIPLNEILDTIFGN